MKEGILSIAEEQNDPEQGDATWSADNGYVTGKEVIVISVHSMQIDCNLFAHYSEIICGASTVPIHCPGGQGVSE